MKILFFMVVRNASKKKELFTKVIESASKVSKEFYVVDHGSGSDSIEFMNQVGGQLGINLTLIEEDFSGTMDDIKAKHFKHIKEHYQGYYIFAIDSDEVISKELANEINTLDYKNSVYLIRRDSFFLGKTIRENELLPLFFEVNSVEINTFSAIHNLYKIHNQNTKNLKGILYHFSYENMDDLISKIILYSRIEAKEMYKVDPDKSFLYILFRISYEGIGNFLYQLFVFRNYRHLEGFFYAFSNIPRVFIKYLYYFELIRKNK